MKMQTRKIITGGAIGLTALAIGLGGSPAEAATQGRCWSNSSQTCYPTMSADFRPWSSPNGSGPQDNWTIKRGTRVDMRCWTTGASQMGTSKWFSITSQSYPYSSGYVSANSVGSQIVVGHC
jgi:hypothetical protein